MSPGAGHAKFFATVALISAAICTETLSQRALATAPSWPMYRRDVENTGAQPNSKHVAKMRLRLRWVYQADSWITSTPTVFGNSVVVGTWSGRVVALDATRANVRWTAFLGANPDRSYGQPRGVVSSVAVDHGFVYAVSGSCVAVKLGAHTGREAWRQRVCSVQRNDDTYASPVVARGMVLIGIDMLVDKPTDRGVLLALDAKSGALRWRYDPVRYRGTGVGISATPAVDERRGIVFIGTGNPTPRGHPPPGPDRDSESIVALRLATGKKLWTFGPVHPHDTDDDDFFASPNRFLVRPGAQRWVIGEPNKDGTYYAVDAVSGRLFWRRVLVPMDALAEPIGTAAVAHDRIFIPLFGSRGWLVTLRTRDGSVLWRRQLATGAYEAPAVWGNVAFVTTAGGTLFAFDGATGRALATLNVGGRLEGRGPSVVGNSLYLAAGSVLRAYTIETQPR